MPAGHRTGVWNDEAKERFCSFLAEGYSVRRACIEAGVGRSWAYTRREADPEFKKMWDDAYAEGADVYKDECRRRAVEGVEEPVFYQGEVCGAVRRYSDTLLIFITKQRDPSFRDNSTVALTGPEGEPLQLFISKTRRKADDAPD